MFMDIKMQYCQDILCNLIYRFSSNQNHSKLLLDIDKLIVNISYEGTKDQNRKYNIEGEQR